MEGRGKEKLRESLGCFEVNFKKKRIIASLTRHDEDDTYLCGLSP